MASAWKKNYRGRRKREACVEKWVRWSFRGRPRMQNAPTAAAAADEFTENNHVACGQSTYLWTSPSNDLEWYAVASYIDRRTRHKNPVKPRKAQWNPVKPQGPKDERSNAITLLGTIRFNAVMKGLVLNVRLQQQKLQFREKSIRFHLHPFETVKFLKMMNGVLEKKNNFRWKFNRTHSRLNIHHEVFDVGGAQPHWNDIKSKSTKS